MKLALSLLAALLPSFELVHGQCMDNANACRNALTACSNTLNSVIDPSLMGADCGDRTAGCPEMKCQPLACMQYLNQDNLNLGEAGKQGFLRRCLITEDAGTFTTVVDGTASGTFTTLDKAGKALRLVMTSTCCADSPSPTSAPTYVTQGSFSTNLKVTSCDNLPARTPITNPNQPAPYRPLAYYEWDRDLGLYGQFINRMIGNGTRACQYIMSTHDGGLPLGTYDYLTTGGAAIPQSNPPYCAYYLRVSTDGGSTWQPPPPNTLSGPTSGFGYWTGGPVFNQHGYITTCPNQWSPSIVNNYILPDQMIDNALAAAVAQGLCCDSTPVIPVLRTDQTTTAPTTAPTTASVNQTTDPAAVSGAYLNTALALPFVLSLISVLV